MQTHGLKLHLGKCKFTYDWIEYLGHMMYLGGLKVQQTKVYVITHIPHPMDVSQVQSFMGLANNYQWFMKGFNVIANPFTKLLKVDQVWQWENE